MRAINTARVAYHKEMINGTSWTRRKFNLTDPMTNTQVNNELVKAIEKTQLIYEIDNSIIKTTY